MVNNVPLFTAMLAEAQSLYSNAMLQYTENRAKGRFEKAKLAILNARAYAGYIRSAKRNLSREQARVAALTCDPRTCPECLSGAA